MTFQLILTHANHETTPAIFWKADFRVPARRRTGRRECGGKLRAFSHSLALGWARRSFVCLLYC